MAEKKIQTRIALKIDTLENWSKIWETFKPMAGEKILFQIPNPNGASADANSEVPSGALTNPPQVISKTGDGVTVLRDLPWDSALAADVAAWAKPSDSSYINVATLKTNVTNLQTAVNTTIPNTYATKTELNTAKSDLSKEIDSDVAAAKTAISKEIDSDVAAAKTALVGAAGTANTILWAKKAADDAATAAEGANTNANSRVLTTTYNAEQKAQDDKIAALEGKIGSVTGAMHFKGVVTTNPTTITSGYSNGDVVIYGNKEYVFNNNAFVELGDTTAEAQAITNLQTAVNTTIPNTYATKAELNTAKSNLSKEIDSDVAAARGLITTEIGTAVAAEKARAEQAESDLSTRITTLGKKLTTVSTTANNGLKVTPTTNNDGAKDYKVDIDTDVVFVFDCGSATKNVQNITK